MPDAVHIRGMIHHVPVTVCASAGFLTMPPHGSSDVTLSGQHVARVLDKLLKVKCYTSHMGQGDLANCVN